MTDATPHAESDGGVRAMLDAALAARDKAAAVRCALEAIERDEITVTRMYDVLGAWLSDVGSRWQTGELAVWEEHLASASVRTIVEALYPRVIAMAAEGGQDRGTVLLACPPHEAHDLGLRMLSDRLELAGWRVAFLGADTPKTDIVAAARALEAAAVVLSISTHFHKVAFRALLADLHAALPGVRILVGGPALRHGAHDIPPEDLFDASGLLGAGE